MIQEIRVGAQPLERFRAVLGDERLQRAQEAADRIRRRMARRVFWNVNSTGVGGGVAEMLQSLLSYTRAAGIDTRWVVIEGDQPFFRVTKRLHHALHGAKGDGSALDAEARRIYESTMRRNAIELSALVRPGDIVLLHDPQTAGLAPLLANSDAIVVWRCHIGHDKPNHFVSEGWEFLKPYLDATSTYVFSRASYVPDFCDHGKSTVIQPSIDAFSAKNQALSEPTVRSILAHTGLVDAVLPDEPELGFERDDGTPGRVHRRADLRREAHAPAWETPLVVQVSRWDPLKDPVGVLEGFARLVAGGDDSGAHLVLAGPDVSAVSDDPEGAQVFEQVIEAWRGHPETVRSRVHLASLPMADVEENAAIVNALQRHAAIVVQKSLHEGFGLTVTEAMWKSRAVVASAVGGIQDQIEDGCSGVLLADPRDLDSFAGELRGLLSDPERRARLGQAAHERAREYFLGVDHLLKYAQLIERLDG